MNRVGRAGPICRRAFARPYKLMVIGNYSFWIAQAGISKGRKTDAAADVVARRLSRQRAATCPRLPALRSFDRRLIPQGASTDGEATRVCAPMRRTSLVRTSRPGRSRKAWTGGQACRSVVLPSFAARELESGTAGTTRRLPRITRVSRQNGKSLQWIERLKRSPSPN